MSSEEDKAKALDLMGFGNRKKKWWDYTLGDLVDYLRWRLWKYSVRYAIEDGRTATCLMCNEKIFPGDFVATPVNEETKSVGPLDIVHAGFHFTMESSSQTICETGGVACGIWNGMWIEKFKGLREPLSSKAIQNQTK